MSNCHSSPARSGDLVDQAACGKDLELPKAARERRRAEVSARSPHGGWEGWGSRCVGSPKRDESESEAKKISQVHPSFSFSEKIREPEASN
jgi:hypothetical protein